MHVILIHSNFFSFLNVAHYRYTRSKITDFTHICFHFSFTYYFFFFYLWSKWLGSQNKKYQANCVINKSAKTCLAFSVHDKNKKRRMFYCHNPHNYMYLKHTTCESRVIETNKQHIIVWDNGSTCMDGSRHLAVHCATRAINHNAFKGPMKCKCMLTCVDL